MGLHFQQQDAFPIIGTKSGTTRTSWALTSAYQTETGTQPTKSFAIAGQSKLNLDVLYTMGAAETANSIEIKVECSPDKTNWYRIPNEAVSTTTSTIYNREFTHVGVDAAADPFSIGLDVFYKFIRVSCKETGVASAVGSVYIEATVSGI